MLKRPTRQRHQLESLEPVNMDEDLEDNLLSSAPLGSCNEKLSHSEASAGDQLRETMEEMSTHAQTTSSEQDDEQNSSPASLEQTVLYPSDGEVDRKDTHIKDQGQTSLMQKKDRGFDEREGSDMNQSMNELPTDEQPGGGIVESDTPTVRTETKTDCESQNMDSSFSHENEQPMEGDGGYSLPSVKFDFTTCVPQRLISAKAEFQEMRSNFLKGCKWSPDGSCLLTNSDDNSLRLFNLPSELCSGTSSDTLPEMSSVLQMSEGETVYDYCWYPYMDSSQPDTCCLLSTSRDHPLHLWDAFTGQLRCSYRPYNHMDEIVAATSVSFNNDGSRIFCGFNKTIKIFDTNRPGRDCVTKHTTVKKKGGQSGIISAIAFSPESAIYALGSFSKTVGVYDESSYQMMCLLEGHIGGVTHVMFSPDGIRLFSGARKDNEILCWDLRYPGAVLYSLLRQVDTNQRIYFHMDSTGQYVVSGNQNGVISVWDTYSTVDTTLDVDRPTLLPTLQFQAHDDCVNGVSLHPSLPLLASASGQRKFPLPGVTDGDEDDNMENIEEDAELREENSVHLWSLA